MGARAGGALAGQDYAWKTTGCDEVSIFLAADGRRLCTSDILHVTSIRYAVLPEWWDVEEWAFRVR
jgi:hypothetical protein